MIGIRYEVIRRGSQGSCTTQSTGQWPGSAVRGSPTVVEWRSRSCGPTGATDEPVDAPMPERRTPIRSKVNELESYPVEDDLSTRRQPQWVVLVSAEGFLAIVRVSIDRFLQNVTPSVVQFSIVSGSAFRHDAQHRRLESSPLRMFPIIGSVAQIDNTSPARHRAWSSATSDGKPNGETEFPTCLRSVYKPGDAATQRSPTRSVGRMSRGHVLRNTVYDPILM